jgi:hypothetical protein
MGDDEEETLEVFRAPNELAVQAAVHEVLDPLDIEAYVHNRVSSALPAPAAMPGDYFIAVPVDRADDAIAALKEAVADGAIEGEVTVDIAPATEENRGR